MSIHHSEPIQIINNFSRSHSGVSGDQGSFERMRHDTRKKNFQSRTRTSSLSPGLASPTPPTYVPDGSHQVSAIGNYYLVENVEGFNAGNVFRAIDFNTDDEYICKVYDTKDYRHAVDRYMRVAQHPNINHVMDIINSSDKAYVFFLSGVRMSQSDDTCDDPSFRAENLHSYVRSKKKLPETIAAKLFTQVVAAVAHCHKNNIVLKDLKLRKFIFKYDDREEVMLENLDDAWILESEDDLMIDRHGCPAYASPEMVSCSVRSNSTKSSYSGKASDVWSLGVMLYSMLVGRYPFLESDPISLFTKISRCQFSLPDSLSSEARDLLRNLLRLQPSLRLTAHSILDHPWLKRQGDCWDTPRSCPSLGSGGNRRRMDRNASQQFGRHSGGHSFPPSIFSSSYYDDQMVPDIVTVNSSQDLVFSFGE